MATPKWCPMPGHETPRAILPSSHCAAVTPDKPIQNKTDLESKLLESTYLFNCAMWFFLLQHHTCTDHIHRSHAQITCTNLGSHVLHGWVKVSIIHIATYIMSQLTNHRWVGWHRSILFTSIVILSEHIPQHYTHIHTATCTCVDATAS